jgi:hypothetical protein
VVVDVLDVEGVDVAGEVPQKSEADVDEEVGAAACDAVDAYGWDWRRDYVSKSRAWKA